jgi:hypothetical protein
MTTSHLDIDNALQKKFVTRARTVAAFLCQIVSRCEHLILDEKKRVDVKPQDVFVDIPGVKSDCFGESCLDFGLPVKSGILVLLRYILLLIYLF